MRVRHVRFTGLRFGFRVCPKPKPLTVKPQTLKAPNPAILKLNTIININTNANYYSTLNPTPKPVNRTRRARVPLNPKP